MTSGGVTLTCAPNQREAVSGLKISASSLPHFVYRNRKTDSLRALNNGDVDADQIASQIDQRAAAVAGIDHGVGLQPIFHFQFLVLLGHSALLGTENAPADRFAQAERISQRHDRLAEKKIVVLRPSLMALNFSPLCLALIFRSATSIAEVATYFCTS